VVEFSDEVRFKSRATILLYIRISVDCILQRYIRNDICCSFIEMDCCSRSCNQLCISSHMYV